MDADALVIGAGAAGLAAARALAERSVRVVLIEARDRIGGRIFPNRVEGLVTPPELGAEFIHGRAEETLALLREAGTAALDIAPEGWSYEGGRLQREEDEMLEWGSLLKRADALAQDESVDEFLRRFEKVPAMRAQIDDARSFVEGFEAADPAIASVRAIAAEIESGVDSRSARPLGGYAPLLRSLRDACFAAGVQVELSTRVRRIAWQRGRIAVDAVGSAGMARTFEAPAAIITLPIGVLGHRGDENAVVFDPELPTEKRDALDHIAMGHVVKVTFWFRSPFWESVMDGRYHAAAFLHGPDLPMPTFWTQLPIRSELVVAWAGGPKASALRRRPVDELVAMARDDFGALFGATEIAREEFAGAAMHDWSDDPFSNGAYSYVTVGGGDARARLAASLDDTLFFAGEATSTDGQGGTVNGALQTGARAASELKEALLFS
jgi:monoamine oxidase